MQPLFLANEGNRTPDRALTKRLLYRLSYVGVWQDYTKARKKVNLLICLFFSVIQCTVFVKLLAFPGKTGFYYGMNFCVCRFFYFL